MPAPTKITDGSHIRPWPNPLVTFANHPWCHCSVVWAPDISNNANHPWVLKIKSRMCYTHRKVKNNQ